MINITSDVTLVDYLRELDVKIRPTVIPTLLKTIVCYDGVCNEEYIVSNENQKVFYEALSKYIEKSIKPQINDDVKMVVERIVIDTRKFLRSHQKIWSRLYGHARSRLIRDRLGYMNIIHQRHLTNNQQLPIELVINLLFDETPSYGTLRIPKKKLDREDIFLINN